MSNVNIKYKGNSIAAMNEQGTKLLNTKGTYCEDDIQIIFTEAFYDGEYQIEITDNDNGTSSMYIKDANLIDINSINSLLTLTESNNITEAVSKVQKRINTLKSWLGVANFDEVEIDEDIILRQYQFHSCDFLKKVIFNKTIDTSNAERAFGYCSNTLEIEFIQTNPNTSGDLLFRDTSSGLSCFNRASSSNSCTDLILTVPQGFNPDYGIDLHSQSSWKDNKCLELFNKLADLTEEETKVIKLHQTTYNDLSETTKKVATDKNWNVGV